MSTAAEGLQPTEYIIEHLTNLNNLGEVQTKIVDFSIINYDTIFWSTLMGLLTIAILIFAARKATSGVPGRFQGLIELVVELVEAQSKSIVHGDRTFIAPLALLVFCWIIFTSI